MTPDELRERCEQFVQQKFMDNNNPLTPHGHVLELESLCREMIAAGLERAAVMCELMPMATPHNLAVSIRKVAEEAQRVKEVE